MSRLYTPKPHVTEAAHAEWLLVADASHARLFTVAKDDGHLEQFLDLENPDARVQDHNAVSDRRGHVTQGPGAIGHAFEPRETHHEHIAESFAKALCARLGEARRSGELAKLQLLAAPHFLGLLRGNLDTATRLLVTNEVAIDLTHHPIGDIEAAI